MVLLSNEYQTSNSGCSQRCMNQEGSFICQCNAGYTLASDGSTCYGKESSLKILCKSLVMHRVSAGDINVHSDLQISMSVCLEMEAVTRPAPTLMDHSHAAAILASPWVLRGLVKQSPPHHRLHSQLHRHRLLLHLPHNLVDSPLQTVAVSPVPTGPIPTLLTMNVNGPSNYQIPARPSSSRLTVQSMHSRLHVRRTGWTFLIGLVAMLLCCVTSATLILLHLLPPLVVRPRLYSLLDQYMVASVRDSGSRTKL